MPASAVGDRARCRRSRPLAGGRARRRPGRPGGRRPGRRLGGAPGETGRRQRRRQPADRVLAAVPVLSVAEPAAAARRHRPGRCCCGSTSPATSWADRWPGWPAAAWCSCGWGLSDRREPAPAAARGRRASRGSRRLLPLLAGPGVAGGRWPGAASTYPTSSPPRPPVRAWRRGRAADLAGPRHRRRGPAGRGRCRRWSPSPLGHGGRTGCGWLGVDAGARRRRGARRSGRRGARPRRGRRRWPPAGRRHRTVAHDAGTPGRRAPTDRGRLVAVWGPDRGTRAGRPSRSASPPPRRPTAPRPCWSTPTSTAVPPRRCSPCSTRCRACSPPPARRRPARSTRSALAESARQVAPRLRVLTGLPRADRWTALRPAALRGVLSPGRSRRPGWSSSTAASAWSRTRSCPSTPPRRAATGRRSTALERRRPRAGGRQRRPARAGPAGPGPARAARGGPGGPGAAGGQPGTRRARAGRATTSRAPCCRRSARCRWRTCRSTRPAVDACWVNGRTLPEAAPQSALAAAMAELAGAVGAELGLPHRAGARRPAAGPAAPRAQALNSSSSPPTV